MLAPGQVFALGSQDVEAAADDGARVGRRDHVVDVAALDEDVDIVGLSILSGSHLELVPDVLDRLREAGSTAAVVVGGIIPPDDAELLIGKGVASVYTPKDYSFDAIMEDLLALAERQRAATRA